MKKEIKEEIEETVEDMSHDEEAISLYYDKKKHEQAMENTWISEAKKEGMQLGIEEGIKQGIEEGKKNKSIEIAKTLSSMNMSDDDIIKATGLTIEKINEIKNNN